MSRVKKTIGGNPEPDGAWSALRRVVPARPRGYSWNTNTWLSRDWAGLLARSGGHGFLLSLDLVRCFDVGEFATTTGNIDFFPAYCQQHLSLLT